MNSRCDAGDISLFRMSFPVRITDLDMKLRAPMPVICKYFQEIGLTHGSMVVNDAGIANDDIVFVLTRLQVRMEEYPTLGDEMTIETWLSPIVDKYVVRNFMLYNRAGKLIGTGLNSAVPFSMKQRTAGVLPSNLDRVQTLDRKMPVDHSFGKISLPDSFPISREIPVGYFDCDLYRHVNNAKYVEWCLEALSPDYIKSKFLHEIDINFRAEGNAGDRLLAQARESEDGSGVFTHVIMNGSGDRDLVRMMSVWRQS